MRRLLLTSVIALLLLNPLAALAQDDDELTNVYFFPSSGIQIRYPEHWDTVTDGSSIYFQTDEILVTPNWYFPASFEQFDIVPGDISTVIVRRFFAADEIVTFDPSAIESVILDGVEVFIYEYTDEDADGPFDNVIIARELRNAEGGFVAYFVIDVLPYTGSTIPLADQEAAVMVTVSAELVGPAGADAKLINRVNLRQTGMIIDTPAGWIVEDSASGYDIASAYTRFTPFWFFTTSIDELGLSPDNLTSTFHYLARAAFASPLEVDANDIQEITIDGSTFLLYDYVDEDETGVYEGFLAATTLADGTIFAANIYPPISSNIQEREAALRVFASARIEREITTEDAPLDAFIAIDTTHLPYPAHWDVELEEGFVRLFSDYAIFDPYTIGADRAANPATAIAQLMTDLNTGIQVQAADVVLETVEGVEIASMIYSYPTAADDAVVLAAQLPDGGYLLLDLYRRFNAPLPVEEVTIAQRMLAGAVSGGTNPSP